MSNTKQASMGPGCFHPRNGSWSCCRRLAAYGFNGAGMFPSQKSRRPLSASPPRVALQWGRDVSIPEMPSVVSDAIYWAPLQWGRDVSIPEILVSVLLPRAGDWLQWGRDVSIPEMAESEGCYAAVGCFNGAGMFPSQKSAIWPLPLTLMYPLQWGRDVSIPEIRPVQTVAG